MSKKDDRIVQAVKNSTLNDAAALLIQLDPDDIPGLAELHESLENIAGDESCCENCRENIVRAIEIVENIIRRDVPDPDSAVTQVGDLIEIAMNAVEEQTYKKESSSPGDPVPHDEKHAPEDPTTDHDDENPSEAVSDDDESLPAVPAPEQADRSVADDPRPNYMPEDVDIDLMSEFITEGIDLIASAEEALLTLETNPEDTESIGTVFRAFHTIKGNSAFLEITLLSEIAHHAESLLSRVRNNEIRYAGGYADLALRSLDMIKYLIDSVQDALNGEPLTKPDGYDDLMGILANPEAAGISDKTIETSELRVGDILVAQGKVDRESVEKAADEPRLGDILIAQDKVDREELEKAAAAYPDKPIGEALVESKAASVKDVGQALRTQRQMKDAKKTVQASVRVSTDRLDQLIDMVGELVIAHSMVAQDQVVVNNNHHDLLKKVAHTNKIVRELQDMSMSMRMVPLKSTFQKMTRLVRDLARNTGKTIDFVTEGEDTEIDRNMADAIKDPLVHMVRNSVDHGIEPPEVRRKNGKPEHGRVKLSAYHSAGSVVVEIKDDGKGIDRDVILAKALEKGLISDGDSLSDREVFSLIFEPGFSTAKTVTEVSGRGVGMDVVRRNIESLRGQVEIQSEPGKGSVFQMKLPLTLAIIDGMVARVGCETYVIPTLSIITSVKADRADLSTVLNRGEMLSLQGKLIPLFRLANLFHIDGAEKDQDQPLIVVVENDGNQAGLIVDELVDRQQVVIKTLGEAMQNLPGISGGAIMPNGRVGLILDVTGVVKLANAGNGDGVTF